VPWISTMPPATGHHHVHVGVTTRILGVVKVENGRSLVDADRNGGDVIAQRVDDQPALGQKMRAGIIERQPGAGDGGAARSAVGLQDVAVERNLAFAERLEVGHRTQGTADQTLDFLGAASLLAFRRFALRTGVRRAGQHAIFGGDPARSRAAPEGRHELLDAGRAQHARVADLDQYRAFGVACELARNAHLAQL
jgi:hypothetical protein